ncbi:MAG TPA: 2-oxoacid:acceptor oxidoreductase family protein [bacterium]|nr:2-oxoacid:acceptor oxidoreductase family protein [bacterium]
MTLLQKPASYFDRFARKPGEQKHTTHYCPGCGHGILHKLLAEAISDLQLQDTTLLVGPVGCGVFLYYYYHCAAVSSPHGRASAVATGVSRANPGGVTVAYQGDGDLAALGTSNAIHAANRGENMLVLFINNNVYGMTGGQMAPTTLIEQKTTTTPYGRSAGNEGMPLRMAEIMATLEMPVLVARVAVNSPKNIRQARQVLRTGLQVQQRRQGYVFIEVLSPCPTNWRKQPIDACAWIDDVVTKYYPLGVFRDRTADAPACESALRRTGFADIAALLKLQDGAAAGYAPAPADFRDLRLKSAGFGGQGVLSLGTLVAAVAMHKGLEATWLPSYGPEMRGGTANSSVVVSRQPIGSPVVDHPTLLVAMNQPSLERFGPQVPADGLVIWNSSLIPALPAGITAPAVALPATELAQACGSVKVANTVVLGFIARHTGLFSIDELLLVLQDYFSDAKIIALNRTALKRGWDAAGETRV